MIYETWSSPVTPNPNAPPYPCGATFSGLLFLLWLNALSHRCIGTPSFWWGGRRGGFVGDSVSPVWKPHCPCSVIGWLVQADWWKQRPRPSPSRLRNEVTVMRREREVTVMRRESEVTVMRESEVTVMSRERVRSQWWGENVRSQWWGERAWGHSNEERAWGHSNEEGRWTRAGVTTWGGFDIFQYFNSNKVSYIKTIKMNNFSAESLNFLFSWRFIKGDSWLD